MAELTYTKNGDYLIPNIVMDEQPKGNIGKYGMLRKTYLKEHRSGTYTALLLTCKLWAHILEIDRTAQERIDRIMDDMLKTDPAPDKAIDQMGWVQHMNSLKAVAEETVLNELIYN